MRPSHALAAVVLAALAVGCSEDTNEVPSVTDVVMPESRNEGIQATGTLDGARIAVSRGNPTVVVGDCDANDGLDDDVCILSRTIDGLNINLVIENPAALVEGESVDVIPACADPCDEVTDGVVIDLRVDGDSRRAESGTLRVAAAGPRYTADFDVRFVGGDRLIGTFDVVPTPPS